MNLFVLYLTSGQTKRVTADRYHQVGHALEFYADGHVIVSVAARLVICVDSDALSSLPPPAKEAEANGGLDGTGR